MLLLAGHGADALGTERLERLIRMLEQSRHGRRGHRAHRRRQVQQPARIDSEPAHHLKGRRGIIFLDRDPAVVCGLYRAAAGHVRDVKRVRITAPGLTGRLRWAGIGSGGVGREWPCWLVVDPGGRHGDELALGVAQRRQPAAEHAAGVQAHGPIHPFRSRNRRVAVKDHRLAPVVVRPRVPDRQPELVGLPRRLPVQAERPDPARGAALEALGQAGVADH